MRHFSPNSNIFALPPVSIQSIVYLTVPFSWNFEYFHKKMPGKNGYSLPHFPRHFKYFHKKCLVKEYTLLSPATCNLTSSLSPATSHPPPATYHLPPIFILRIKSAWQRKKCLAAVLPRCRIFCTPVDESQLQLEYVTYYDHFFG